MSSDRDSETHGAGETGAGSPQLTPQQEARRTLLRGGVGVAPVVLSVASRPVMASTGACTTASAFGSINASRPRNVTSCGGRKPAYWKNPGTFALWPRPHCATRKTNWYDKLYFNEVFGWGYAADVTLLQVLQTTNSGRDAVARHCVAAVLNAGSGLTPSTVLSIQRTREVWKSYLQRGYFEPTAGVRWYADSSTPSGAGSILQWLESTMPN